MIWGAFLKRLTLILALLLILPGLMASGVKAPNALDITEEGASFEVSVENTFDKAQSLEVEFYPPSNHSISRVPSTIASNSKLKLNVTLDYDADLAGQTYTALLRARVGEDYYSKEITLNYLAQEPVTEPETEPENGDPSPSTGFFVLPAFGFDQTTEIIIDIVLILFAAILLIGFISRLTKRMRGAY